VASRPGSRKIIHPRFSDIFALEHFCPRIIWVGHLDYLSTNGDAGNVHVVARASFHHVGFVPELELALERSN
jgi:hypothetical protein